MNLEKLKEVCDHFSASTGIGLMVIDREGNTVYETKTLKKDCQFCDSLNLLMGKTEGCRQSRLYGGYQAQRFGGRYIFFCHMGLTHFSSPIIKAGILEGSMIGGPLLMIDPEEYLQDEVFTRTRKLFTEEEKDRLGELVVRVPVVPPERVHALSELLYICADYVGEQKSSEMSENHENQKLQGIISDYIMRIKNEGDTGFYPLQKEDELMDAMSNGDVKAAKALLNELLGYIFFYSGFRFDVIRSRVLELIVLLSRAAVKGGADAELIFGLNYEYLKEIDRFGTIEELTHWLSVIMNRFTDYVFNFVGVKHADVIFKATDYIKTNYVKKITLEEVAGYVYLSPAYFSKVFKEETKSSFSSYLNKIRIEQSKKLLLNHSINLSDICNMVGYEDQSYFSKVFKKVTGMSPLRYRQSRGK